MNVFPARTKQSTTKQAIQRSSALALEDLEATDLMNGQIVSTHVWRAYSDGVII
jgi:hypothetical protein